MNAMVGDSRPGSCSEAQNGSSKLPYGEMPFEEGQHSEELQDHRIHGLLLISCVNPFL